MIKKLPQRLQCKTRKAQTTRNINTQKCAKRCKIKKNQTTVWDYTSMYGGILFYKGIYMNKTRLGQ